MRIYVVYFCSLALIHRCTLTFYVGSDKETYFYASNIYLHEMFEIYCSDASANMQKYIYAGRTGMKSHAVFLHLNFNGMKIMPQEDVQCIMNRRLRTLI